MSALWFKVLRFIFSVTTSALLAWPIAAAFNINTMWVFLFLALGLPMAGWLDRLKNVPAHLAAAAILNKQLVADTKRTLGRLPLTSAEEWNDFRFFYESDEEITKYRASNPKAAAVAIRSEFAMLRAVGLIIPYFQGSWVITQAIEQMWEEKTQKSAGIVDTGLVKRTGKQVSN